MILLSLRCGGFRWGSFGCYDNLGCRNGLGRRSDHRICFRDGPCGDISISHDKNKFAIWTVCDYSASFFVRRKQYNMVYLGWHALRLFRQLVNHRENIFHVLVEFINVPNKFPVGFFDRSV